MPTYLFYSGLFSLQSGTISFCPYTFLIKDFENITNQLFCDMSFTWVCTLFLVGLMAWLGDVLLDSWVSCPQHLTFIYPLHQGVPSTYQHQGVFWGFCWTCMVWPCVLIQLWIYLFGLESRLTFPILLCCDIHCHMISDSFVRPVGSLSQPFYFPWALPCPRHCAFQTLLSSFFPKKPIVFWRKNGS